MLVNLPIFKAISIKFPFGHVIKPVQFSPRMLAGVEIRKPTNATFQLERKDRFKQS